MTPHHLNNVMNYILAIFVDLINLQACSSFHQVCNVVHVLPP